jgi:BlaI family transcriptional regulator, penicillinase repressor
MDDLLDLFGGSGAAVMSQLVETGKLSLQDIRDAEQALGRLERKQ